MSKAWEELRRANNSENFSVNEFEGVAYVAFPSFHKIEGFMVEERKYGEERHDKFMSPNGKKGN